MCLTHCYTLLEVFLATDEVGDLWGDIIGNGASVDLYPFSNLFHRALFSEVAGDCYSEAFEGLLPQRCTVGLVAIPFLHRGNLGVALQVECRRSV